MKKCISGKIYDTTSMTVLCSRSAYNNGNYAGETYIGKTPGGAYAVVTTSNGQDLYREDDISEIDKAEIAAEIDGWDLDDDEEQTLKDEGILTDA
jgi:hypothetical protein